MKDAPEVRLETSRVDFGDVWVGASATRTFTLSNAGRPPAQVELHTTAPYSLTETSVTLAGGESRELEVHFTPTAAGPAIATVTVSGLSTGVALSGQGVVPPVCLQEVCATSVFSFDAGACVRTELPDDTVCAAGCGASGTCVSGECLAHDVGNCDDADACTTDACGADGGCIHSVIDCPVTSACQVASCDAQQGCLETPVEDGAACGEATCAEVKLCLDGACATRPTPDAELRCRYDQISVWDGVSCARNLLGEARCWGNNSTNALLRSTVSDGVGPGAWNVGFPIDHFVRRAKVCAASSSGELRCPGFDAGGAFLGLELDRDFQSVCGVTTAGALTCPGMPDAGDALASVTELRIESDLACARASDGGVGCWKYPELLSAQFTGPYAQIPFSGPVTTMEVAPQGRGLLGLMPDGGTESFSQFQGPVSVGAHAPWSQLGVQTKVVYGLERSGQLDVCEEQGASSPCAPAAAFPRFSQLSVSTSHACAIDLDAGVWCWGWNIYGEAGELPFAEQPLLMPLEGVVAHTAEVTCFRDGGCVDARKADHRGAVAFAPPGPVVDACSGLVVTDGGAWQSDHDGGTQRITLAVTCDPRVLSFQGTRCTLEDDAGLTCPTHLDLPPVRTLRGSAFADGVNACVLTTSGQVWCWTTGVDGGVPTQKPLIGVRQLEGDLHWCALYGVNGVSCWGANDENALGSPGPASQRPLPIAIGEPVSKLSREADCALLTSGRMVCWSRAGSDAPYETSTPLPVIK